MIDQATELRKLVLRAMRAGSTGQAPAPRLMLIASGRSAVGVTSLGVNIAVALSQQGLRVVLVDADTRQPGVAGLCGLAGCEAHPDLTVPQRDIHEVLQRGPAGIQIVPALRIEGGEGGVRPLSMERFLRQLTRLGKHTDCVLVDLGQGTGHALRSLVQVADDILVVTTPDNDSITATYTYIKLAISGFGAARLWLIVNFAEETLARDVHQRMCQSCERFLGHGITLLGWMPDVRQVSEAARQRAPFVLAFPDAPASGAVQKLAMELALCERKVERTKAKAG